MSIRGEVKEQEVTYQEEEEEEVMSRSITKKRK